MLGQWTQQQKAIADAALVVRREELKKEKNMLTIILGKNLGKLPDVDAPSGQLIFFPELTVVGTRSGILHVPQHPDAFIPDTVEWIEMLLGIGKNVQLWTMSEYLVSAIAQEVGRQLENSEDTPKWLYTEDVQIRLYADDNSTFRRFGIDNDGRLCDTGDGSWPFGWFMPSS